MKGGVYIVIVLHPDGRVSGPVEFNSWADCKQAIDTCIQSMGWKIVGSHKRHLSHWEIGGGGHAGFRVHVFRGNPASDKEDNSAATARYARGVMEARLKAKADGV